MSRLAVLEELWGHAPLVAPSMLKCNFARLGDEVRALSDAGSRMLHWDVMDGHFVPNLSYGAMLIRQLRDATAIPFEAHLMISEPGRYLDEFVAAGCNCITVHVEAAEDPVPLLRRIREADVVAGLALNPGTPESAVSSAALEQCDIVLVMSVEPGFGGQKFMPSVLEKVRRLRSLASSDTLISVDGGIGPTTIGAAAEAGAQIFVAGTSIFGSGDYRGAIERQTEIAADNHGPHLV